MEAAIFFSFAASFLCLRSTADGPGDSSLGPDPQSHSGLEGRASVEVAGAVGDPRLSSISAQPQSLPRDRSTRSSLLEGTWIRLAVNVRVFKDKLHRTLHESPCFGEGNPQSSLTSPTSSDGERGPERPAFLKATRFVKAKTGLTVLKRAGGAGSGRRGGAGGVLWGCGGVGGGALYTRWEKYPTIFFFQMESTPTLKNKHIYILFFSAIQL